MAATESQIATIYRDYGCKSVSEIAEDTGLSKRTVNRYIKKAKEEGVISVPEGDKSVIPSCARELMGPVTDSVPIGQNVSIHTVSKNVTIAEMSAELETARQLRNKAMDRAVNDPQQAYLVVQHTKNILKILENMAKWCGLDKGTFIEDPDKVSKVKVEWE